MSAGEEQSLSADELRRKLYQSFKRRGVLDSVKTQLRNQLIVELQRDSPPRPGPAPPASLSSLASNSLVIDHLRSSGYEYTLSVFYPECGISKDKVLPMKDILELLRVSAHSPLYHTLMDDIHSKQNGVLLSLLSELIDHRLQTRVSEVETQTADAPDHGESLVRKMQVIDEEYEVLRQRGRRWASVEVKLAEYRKELEEQAQVELKSRMQHFQEVEISRVRMEEKEKCQQEMLEVRRQLERNHEMKSEALMSREKNAIERLQKQQQMEERDIYSQRQALLKEIESVRNRDAELRLRMEAFEKSCKLHEEKMRSSEDLLRKRELDVKKMEEMYELKLNTEIRNYQLELKEDYARRTEALAESESRNKEETVRIQSEAAAVDARREEHRRVLSQLARLQEELASERGNVCVLTQQNAVLNEKLEGVSDYATIRNDREELQAEVHLLKRQLEESQEEKRRLRQDFNRPSPELLALQVEMKSLEVAHRLDQEDLQKQKQVLQDRLTQEVERCAQFKSQLLECEEKTRWMSSHIEELKQQLRHTQQALENKVLWNPKPSDIDHSVLDLDHAGLSPTDDHLRDPESATRGQRRSRTEGEDVVAAALSRVQELEKEAETVEEAYRSYRRRRGVSHVPFKGASPPPTLEPPNFVRPIGAAKSRVVTEDVYTATGLNRCLAGHMTPPTVSSPPVRRLSSTPVSASKIKPRAQTEKEVMFSGLSSQREVSPIPVVGLGEHTHITPPNSPQLKDIARNTFSPPNSQSVSSSSQESPPQPEKINIQDLTEGQADVLYSLAQLQDQQVEEAHTQLEQQDNVVQSDAKEEEEESLKEEERRSLKEEEERRSLKEEEERRSLKEEEERRSLKEEEERRSLKEEGRRDLELLQQEDLQEQDEEKKKEETEVGTEGRVEGTEEEKEESRDDALHKYMLMVMQGREREKEQNTKKDESENLSPEPVLLSDHKDNSIAAFSQEDADDDFW
ncbi:centriole and centriolar satellite protein ofd1 isoform 1-T1 [Clarias gariepinus]